MDNNNNNSNQNLFPEQSGWVETPKLRKRIVIGKRASSVPTTPILQKNSNSNHFEILSPPSSPVTSTSSSSHKKKKKKKSSHSNNSSMVNSINNRSPLHHEIGNDDWDDHVVPSISSTDLEGGGLHITRNDSGDQLQSPVEPTSPAEPQPSPIETSSPPQSLPVQQQEQRDQQQQPNEALRQISFLDYLKDELTVADFDSAQELKRERVTNFLGVPGAIEKV